MNYVVVSSSAAREVERGTLHIYAQHVVEVHAKDGDWVEIRSNGEVLGYGFYSARSSIPVKLFTRDISDPREYVEERLRTLYKRKKRIYGETFRWVFAEGDLLPGLIVDKYRDVAVVRYTIIGWENLIPALESILRGYVDVAYLKNERGREVEKEHRFLFGKKQSVVIEEGKARFEVDIVKGQKTGFYLDQRDNRLEFEHLVEGKVLDAFAYTGAFGIHAALQGCDVTFVELGKGNVELLQRNIRLNEVDGTVVRGDALKYMAKNKGKFDVVVVDPPALSKQGKGDAHRMYFKINQFAVKALKDGGLLVSCSCTQSVTPKDFLSILRAVAREEGVRMRMLGSLRGQAKDHTVYLPQPETLYLKCAFLEVEKS